MSAAMFFFALQAMSATNVEVDSPMAATPTTPPTWADEFDGTTIDAAKWQFDTSRNNLGWYNDEKQYYAADRPENARIEKGSLIIEARHETLSPSRYPDWGGQSYTSAKLISRRQSDFGFYEIRAKLPCGRGTWPALWMLPDGGTWPDAGEIDIMEMVGWDPNVAHATLHTALFNHKNGTQRGAQMTVPTACATFHTYQLDWQPKSITIGIDGHAFMRVADDQPGGRRAWPFTKPYRMILNLAVGGAWGGARGIDDAALPQRMDVDYVRYWKR
ncbi:glycoside hydrolase family 16 protein [Sphingomonas sp. UYP23]